MGTMRNLILAGMIVFAAAGEAMGQEAKKIIQGVDKYRVVEAMYEGVRVIMTFHGEKYSAAYVQGISGMAFRIGGICPCAPTCIPGIEPKDLPAIFGYKAELVPFPEDKAEHDAAAADLVARIKDEVRAGRPVLVWNAFTTAEFDVVCGFDEDEKVLYGRGSYAGMDEYAKAPETKLKDFDPALGAIFIRPGDRKFDARKAETASLSEAVRHARSRRNEEKLGKEKWTFLDGIMCFERWVNDFKNPEKKREAGDAYCYGIFRSTHQAAADYLAEIAPNYPKAKKRLLAASRHFAKEARILNEGEDLLWWQSSEGPDAERNKKAAKLLARACAEYKKAIDDIEAALPLLD